MNNSLQSKSGNPCKMAFPFRIDIDPMERLVVVNLKNDPEFEMIEPQVFDDPVNGKGMRVIVYRRDKKVDIYWQSGVTVDRETIAIGAGIGQFRETVIEPSRFEITDHGVDIHVLFSDAEGRAIELRIEENAAGINPFPFLAPVGKDIDNPKRLFLAHMLEFDFVRKKNTLFMCRIGERLLDPESFPILRNRQRVLFTRYSGFPVVGTLNPSTHKPLVFELETPGRIELDDMVLQADGEGRIAHVYVDKKKKKVELTFPRGFPNLYDIEDGAEEVGEWFYRIAGMRITGGTYYLHRTDERIEIALDVTRHWKPANLPLSFRLFTLFVRSFRSWPATYIWKGTFHLDDASLSGGWSRK